MAFVLKLQDFSGEEIDFLSTTIRLEDGGLRIPAPKRKFVESGPAFHIHGQKVKAAMFQNRDVEIRFEIDGANHGAIAAIITRINNMLERARIFNQIDDRAKSVELAMQLDGQSKVAYFRILNGSLDVPRDFFGLESVLWNTGSQYYLKGLSLSLTCEPFAYGASNYKSWEDSSGDRPTSLNLRNRATAYTTNGITLQNRFDGDGENYFSIKAADILGDAPNATVFVFENTDASAKLSKLFVSSYVGRKFFTLTSTINNSVGTITVNENISYLDVPLRLKIDSEVLYATAKTNSTRQFTVTRGWDSTTPASHTAGATVEVTSLKHTSEAENASFTGLLTGAILTVSVAAGGSGYVLGDVLTIGGSPGSGATVQVTEVTTGAVTTVVIVAPGLSYTVSSARATTGGSGTGCTIDIDDVVDDTYTTRSNTSASNNSYAEIRFQATGIKNLVRFQITEDRVAAIKGPVRVFGKLCGPGSGGTASGNYWSDRVNFRLRMFYLARDNSEIDLYFTNWVSPTDASTVFLDFGTIMFPPFAQYGAVRYSDLYIVVQAQIKPDYVLDIGLNEIQYYLNFDVLYTAPIADGYRILETRGLGLQQNDKIIDDGWYQVLNIEQFPGGSTMGRAGIVNPELFPIFLRAGEEHFITVFRLDETGNGTSEDIIKVKVYGVPSYNNMAAA